MYHFVKLSKEEKINKKVDEIYFKSIEKVHSSPEYIQNKMQIDVIKQTLIEQNYVSEKLVDWLIESVEENTALEYEFANKKIYKKLSKKAE